MTGGNWLDCAFLRASSDACHRCSACLAQDGFAFVMAETADNAALIPACQEAVAEGEAQHAEALPGAWS